MVKATARPEKESFILVQFLHGANIATEERYTDFDQDFLGHASTPTMELNIPENEGTFAKRELRIILPTDVFTNRASGGVPHSPIFVIVEEVTQGLFTGDQNSQKTLYRGRVVRTIKNYQGRDNRVAFFSLPQKSRIDVQMGLPCNHQCAWTLFKGGCGASEAAFQITTEIISKDGHEVVITDTQVTALGTADNRYWKRGYMEKDGLRISIRDYDGSVDITRFQMADPVPTDWIAGTNDIRIVPGCDKSVEVCISRFNQEETFLGMGRAIPAYHPIIESPS